MIVYNKKNETYEYDLWLSIKKWNLWIWLSIIKKMKPMNMIVYNKKMKPMTMIVYNKKTETYEYDCL